MKARWAGFYTDVRGREPIVIELDGRQLRTQIRGVTFAGDGLNNLAPVTALSGGASFTLYFGTLASCALEWAMSIGIGAPDGTRQGQLGCQLTLGDPADRPSAYREDLSLWLDYDGGQARTTQAHDTFEGALAELAGELPPGTSLRACISCALSAYPPLHGRDLFGGLACFRDAGPAFLAAKSRPELASVWESRTEFVPEMYLCPKFVPAEVAQLGWAAEAG